MRRAGWNGVPSVEKTGLTGMERAGWNATRRPVALELRDPSWRVDVDGIWGYQHGKMQGSREILI